MRGKKSVKKHLFEDDPRWTSWNEGESHGIIQNSLAPAFLLFICFYHQKNIIKIQQKHEFDDKKQNVTIAFCCFWWLRCQIGINNKQNS